MADRVTQKDLTDIVKRINRKLEPRDLPTIGLRNAYGLWGVDAEVTGNNLTNLMPKRELLIWLWGFEEAMETIHRGGN